jgi:hypothetical protein
MARSSTAASPEARPLAIRLRSTHPRGAGADGPRHGDIVLRARVIAKLLGLRLLTLDAEVLIDSYSDSLTAPTEAESAAVRKLSEIPHAARRVRGSANGLSRAMELLEQSDAVLASCVRHRGMPSAW